MERRTYALAGSSALVVLLCGACCFGNLAPPSPEEPGPREAARAYWDAHVAELAPPDAGAAGGCLSGLGALATDVAIAVISRGHAGGDAAGEVRIDVGSCVGHAIVLVVLSAGVWRGVRLIAYDDFGGELARIGADPGYRMEYDFQRSDLDLGSDELF